MHIEQKVNIHNRFDIHIDNIETGEHREIEAYNIVLDQMFVKLCNGNPYFDLIYFGTGTGTPTPNRTTLFNYLDRKWTETVETIKAFPISRVKKRIVLNPEEYVGQTITEVAIGIWDSSNNIVTHAMLKDAEGNPITITKTSTDVVTIFATVFVSLSQSVSLVGLPNNNSLLNYLVGGSAAPTGAFTLQEIPGGFTTLGTSAAVTWTADVANKQRKTNTPRFGITQGNGHIKVLGFQNLFNLELPSPGIFSGQEYTNVPVGTADGVRTTWDMPSWNIDQATLGIKVAGAVVTNYLKKTLNTGTARIANPASFPSGNGFGVALTPDGLIMAVAHYTSPFVTTYDWNGTAWIKRPNPASLPTGNGQGAALTPDGSLMAVAHWDSPHVTTYDWNGTAWIKRPNPASLPGGWGTGAALTPDGSRMAVAHLSSPFVTTYDWNGTAWIKRPNPASVPTGDGYGVALTPDGLVMAVAHQNSPRVTTYDWNGTAWIKRPNPASLPPSNGFGVALTPDGLIMAVAHGDSPYVTTYDWVNNAWIKRPNPASLPPSTGNGVALTPDGLIMAVAHYTSPFVSTYDWNGTAWIKRPNPASLPTSNGNGVALTPDGLIMAVAHYTSPSIATYKNMPVTQVIFDTPPAIGEAITADYTVNGLHKTDQYVVDVSFAIRFGEGV